MKHPNREEWVPYLFGEAAPESKHRLSRHLEDCADCRDELQKWKSSLGMLDSWKLPRPSRSIRLLPQWNWALATACALLLTTGFMFGRYLEARNLSALRASLEPKVRQELRSEFAQMLEQELAKSSSSVLAASKQQAQHLLTDYATSAESRRAEEAQAFYTALTRVENQGASALVSLKKELDTLAVNTDAGLRLSQQELYQLAGSGPVAVPTSFRK